MNSKSEHKTYKIARIKERGSVEKIGKHWRRMSSEQVDREVESSMQLIKKRPSSAQPQLTLSLIFVEKVKCNLQRSLMQVKQLLCLLLLSRRAGWSSTLRWLWAGKVYGAASHVQDPASSDPNVDENLSQEGPSVNELLGENATVVSVEFDSTTS